MLIRRLCFAFLCLSFSGIAAGAVVSDLYSVNVPVASKITAARNQVLPNALRQVLVKVSGQSGLNNTSPLQNALQNPNRYISEFDYQTDTTQTPPTLLLHVVFNEKAINQLLAQAGLSVWSSDRPTTLIWGVVQSGQQIDWIQSAFNTNIQTLFQNQASARGLPISFPLGDVVDLQQVRASDVCTPLTDAMIRASKRYTPDEIASVCIQKTDSTHWQAHWSILSDTPVTTFDTAGGSVDEVIASGMDQLTDHIAQSFLSSNASDTGGPSTITMTVTHLSGVQDYAKVMQYLRDLTGVSNVDVLSVDSSTARFQIQLQNSEDQFKRLIELDSVLSPTSETTADELVYEYHETH